ncbi:E3 ubiquitin-protein ligase FANCL isoform X2 [Harpegnathos saltator]|nr:E3 ubiquitin-protein ligase FANCL isoform X2 [Harpegnathos saltator]
MSPKHNETLPNWHLSTWHPEMILISKSPVTLQGFLIISNLPFPTWDCLQSRIKLQLIAPNYPLLQDAQINFGTAIASLRDKKFSDKVKVLMNSNIRIPTFLTQLQSLIGEHLHNKHHKSHMNYSSLSNFMEDLNTVLLNPSEVQVSSDDNLKTIKLSLNDISVILERNESAEIPWKIISSDFPKIPIFEYFAKNITKLNIAITKFKWQVELLEKAWEQLKEIDENCCVIDPLEPNKSHMHRRIYLSQFISMTITISPLKPTALPEIKLFGSDSEVKKQTDYISNILDWDPDCSILENLKMLLNIYEFPKQQKDTETIEDKNAIIGNRECGICTSEKSEDDELPDKICNNTQCKIHYHSACLSKWLQKNAGNQVVFGYIYGICPYCKEKISCPIEH